MGVLGFINEMTLKYRGGVYGAVDVMYRREKYRKRPNASDRYLQTVIGAYECCAERSKINEKEKMFAIKQITQEVGRDDFLVLPRVVISLTNRCSLRCRDCNALIPCVKEKYDRPVIDQIKDIEKLLEVADRICSLELIGGEPFLYQRIDTIIEFCLKSPKIDQLEITTNGTIMPSEQVMDRIRNDKCFVIFSDYGDINKKSGEIQKKLISEGIHVIDLKNDKWYNAGGVAKRGKSIKRIRYEFTMCDCKDVCRTLYKGKLYVCGRAPILHELKKISNDTDFLDLDDLSKNTIEAKKQLKIYFMSDIAESCDFCDYSSDRVRYVPSGIQL